MKRRQKELVCVTYTARNYLLHKLSGEKNNDQCLSSFLITCSLTDPVC